MAATDVESRAERTAELLGILAPPKSWGEPLPIVSALPPAPTFNAAALLPDTLREFVLDEADRMPCPPDYVAAVLLVSLGSVIGARCALKPKRRDDWIVPANLWGGVVGEPSSKKTPSVSTVMRFVDRLESEASKKLEMLRTGYDAELAAYQAQRNAIETAMKSSAKGKSGTSMADHVRELEALLPPDEPHVRRFKSNDGTTAKLGDLLSVNPDGLLVFRDELTGLLASWDQPGNEGDRAFYLEAWNGTSSHRVDRMARGEVFIPNHCLSVFGGIQPDLLARYLSGVAHSLDNDGRVQRFQVMVYPEAVAWEWRDRYPVRGAREAVRDLFHHLSVLDPVEAGAAPADDFVKLPHFHFSDEAQALFIEWCTELNRERIPREPMPLMRQHLAKFERLFCSIALILHLTQARPGAAVALETALRAAAWCEFLEGHARRVYGLIEAQQVNAARTLSRKLSAGKLPDGFTARDVARKKWSGLGTTPDAEQALGVLEELGHVMGTETRNELGGPATIRYDVNPALRGGAND